MKSIKPLVVVLALIVSLLTVPSGSVAQGGGGGGGPGPVPVVWDPVTVTVLSHPSGVAVCYYDANGDGLLDAGDALYLDASGDTCGSEVTLGTLRLTPFGSFAAYTKVAIGDADLNLAFSPCCAGAPGLADGGAEIDFYDADGNGFVSGGDSLYADSDADNIVSLGDFRWTPYGSLPGGAMVGSGDLDLGLAMETPGGGSDPLDSSFGFWDIDGNGVYGRPDVPYLDLSQGGAGATVDVGDVRLGEIGDGPPGQLVGAPDPDVMPSLKRMNLAGVSICFVSTDGDASYDKGEPLYIDVDADVCGPSVQANDIRLTASVGFSAFSVVRTVDADFGTPMGSSGGAGTTSAGIADMTSELDFYDADGNGLFNHGDTMYADINGDNVVGPGDFRWTPYGSIGAGTVVEAVHVDAGLNLATTAANSGSDPLDTSLAFWDLDGDGEFNGNDIAYLDLSQGGAGAPVSVNDIRLGTFLSGGAGQAVSASDPDAVAELCVMNDAGFPPCSGASTGVAICFVSDDGDQTYDPGESLYIDINADACGAVTSFNDMRLTPFGDQPAFSKVRSVHDDFNVPMTGSGGAGTTSAGIADATSELDYYDADGNGAWTRGDTMYADINGDNVVGPGDFRWTPAAGFAAGTVVVAGDSDVNLALATVAANSGAFSLDASLAFWDVNGDGVFNGDDEAYLDVSAGGSGAIVTRHDVPLKPQAEPAPVDDDGDGHAVPEDCNDADPAIHPGADEIENGIDDDCDGLVDEGFGGPGDADGDGYTSDVDCNDGDASVHPNNNELDNGVDDDCDGTVDEGHDLDGDGYTAVFGNDCDDTDASVRPGQNEVDNGVDDDCDGTIDEGYDLDGDGYTATFGGDCDDADASVYPGQNELDNGKDDNCVDGVDEGYDLDGDGYTVTFGGDCDETDASVHPGQNELDNGKDDNCVDGVDEGYDLDGDGYTPIFGGDCDDTDASVHPGQNELDNGKDDNCVDGIDEGYDLDGDGYTPIFGGDCDDTDAAIHPNNNELDNGKDDDCDGAVDEGFDLDGDGFTPMFGGDCDDGDALIHPGADERDNRIDDDCDDVIDEGVDSDHDGLDYPAELAAGTDPDVADTDGDWLLDGQEVNVYGTDPLDEDTDDDLFLDGDEVRCGSDPNDPMDFLPTRCLLPTLP